MKGAIPLLRLGTTLLATIQDELRDNVAQAFQGDVLAALEKHGPGAKVIVLPFARYQLPRNAIRMASGALHMQEPVGID